MVCKVQNLISILVFFWGLCEGKRKLVNIEMESARIFGNSSDLWYYYADLFIGNPPQKQSLIIDTGSALTGFPCAESCSVSQKCGTHQHKYYSLNGIAI
jgi:hypothetical protein